MQSCGTCLYWIEVKTNDVMIRANRPRVGECRRLPPIVVGNFVPGPQGAPVLLSDSAFPRTRPELGCGEGKPRLSG